MSAEDEFKALSPEALDGAQKLFDMLADFSSADHEYLVLDEVSKRCGFIWACQAENRDTDDAGNREVCLYRNRFDDQSCGSCGSAKPSKKEQEE